MRKDGGVGGRKEERGGSIVDDHQQSIRPLKLPIPAFHLRNINAIVTEARVKESLLVRGEGR